MNNDGPNWSKIFSGGFQLKRLWTIVAGAALSLSLATNTFAHSHLKGSFPEDSDTVTEPLTEIVLEFEGEIEIGSAMDITGIKGGAIKIEEIIVGDGTLTGTLAQPLANDHYEVAYSIISADGHPVEGDFSFKVEVENGAEPVVNNANTSNDAADEESASTIIWIVVAFVVVGAVVALLVRRKR